MLRSQGIPARLAVGYSTGERDNLTGSFTVRARDAHAWVEVLFPGIGWVPFDASPGFADLPANRMPAHWLFSDLSPQLAFSSLGAAPGGAAGVGGALLAIALVVVLAVAWRRSRLLGNSRPVRAYMWAQRWLRLARLPARPPAQTPEEHMSSLRRRAPEVAAALQPLVVALEQASYAGRPHAGHNSLPVLTAAMRHLVSPASPAGAPRRA